MTTLIKYPGDKIACEVVFKHKGKGGSYWVGFAICQGQQDPPTIPKAQWFGGFGNIPARSTLTEGSVTVDGIMPSLPSGVSYNGFRTICTEDPRVVGWSSAIDMSHQWDQNVYKIPAEADVFELAKDGIWS